MAETYVDVGDGYRLWVETTGDPGREPLLLVMGANASGVGWPDGLVERLAAEHLVVRYDHRDTGRSTAGFAERPYALTDLASDAVAVLDGLGIERAHVVGMSLGATLVQLMLLDAPERLLSATLFGASVLSGRPGDEDLPGPDPRLMEVWAEVGQVRPEAEELAVRLRLWRLLHGEALPYDEAEYAALERRIAAHAGSWVSPTAHALADQSGLERGPELVGVRVPTLVVDAPADPLAPPPHAERLAGAIGGARLVRIEGMGHSLPAAVHAPLAHAVVAHTGGVSRA